MIRKAVQQGPSTIMVSLPSEWVKKNNVQKGDPIYLTENSHSLILTTEAVNKENAEITLNIPTRTDFCPRLLTMPYLRGYDVIRINFKDLAVLNAVEVEIKYLLGFEIIKTGENYCIIKNITRGIETEFSNMLDRLMNIIIFLGKEIYNKVKTEDYQDLLLLKSAEVESNKISLLCRRMYNTRLVKEDKNSWSVYTLITLMEAVADEYRFMIDYLNAEKPKLHPKTKELFNQVNGWVKTFNRLFVKFDEKEFVAFWEERQAIQRNFNQFYKLSPTDVYIANKLFNVIELVYHSTYF